MSWMGNKAVELSWTAGLGGLWFGVGVGGLWGPVLLLFLLLLLLHVPPSQKEPGTIGQLPKPLADNNMGKKRGEEEESHSVATTVGML